MLERIARHLFNEDEAHLPETCRLGWDRAKPLAQVSYLKRAHQLLQIMRESTPAMNAAGNASRSTAPHAVWRAMVECAAVGTDT